MKYCYNCGKEVLDEAVVCVGCGVSLKNMQNSQNDQKNLGYAVLSFFIPLVGLILWVVWSDQYPLRSSSCKKGFLFGVLAYVVFIILYMLLIFYLIANGYGDFEYYSYAY